MIATIIHPADKSEPLPYKVIEFPSGEKTVSFEYIMSSLVQDETIEVFAEIVSSSDIMELMQVLDHLVYMYGNRIRLIIPYIPYGRQDRRTNGGKDSFALRIFADMLNSFNLQEVVTFSQHSNVTELLINNLSNVEPYQHFEYREILLNTGIIDTFKISETIIVAPDAGAEKRAYAFAEYFKIDNVFVCSKRRNAVTGDIIGMVGPADIHTNRHIIVVDDICDGGRTFIELAKILPEFRKSLSLVVTHGIFSKGRQVLFDAGYDNVHTDFNFIEERLK